MRLSLHISLYLVAAHDGRLGDLNHHYAHHLKGKSSTLYVN